MKLTRRGKIIFIILALLLTLAGIFVFIKIDGKRQKHFSITFLNIGQGDAALIKFSDGEKMLVDCGPDGKILSKLGSALPFYDRTLDYLIVSHPDLDHYGGCVDVLRRYEVKNIITNGDKKASDPFWQEFNRAVETENANNQIINRAQTKNIGNSLLNFLAPDSKLNLATKDETSNNRSIVFKLTNKNQIFLFTGDMETPLETALINKYGSALKSDILKVAHHGSDSSSGEAFLNVVAPKTAIISVGKNKFGHPSLRVVRHLERAGAKILRTDQTGNVTYVTRK